MHVKIEVYSKQKQTRTIGGEKISSIATTVRESQTLSLSNELTDEQAKDKATRTALFILASRYRAFVEVDKKLPAKLFVRVTIEGVTYSSESALLSTKMENLIAVSMSGLSKIPESQIIAKVMDIHTKGLKASLGHLSRVKVFMTEDETVTGTDFAGLTVDTAGELVNA